MSQDLISQDSTVHFFDRCIREIAAGRLRPIYLTNAEAESLGVKPRLGRVPWHIDPARNPDITVCKGVNRSTFYYAGRYALTDLHVEDNLLDSANVIHCGEPGSGKV